MTLNSRFAVLAAGIIGLGCQEQPQEVCTADFRYGLAVLVRDSVSGIGIASGAHLIARAAGQTDSVVNPVNRPDLDNVAMMAAGERPDTYTVIVRRPDYLDWTRQEVVVTSDECHVQLTSLTALLQRPEVSGQYTATTFTASETGSTVDVLAEGGSLTITLADDRTTTGRLFIPEALNGGEGTLDASLEGTFTYFSGAITFDHDADTFVRDMPFTMAGSTLTGSKIFSGVTVSVVLTRQ